MVKSMVKSTVKSERFHSHSVDKLIMVTMGKSCEFGDKTAWEIVSAFCIYLCQWELGFSLRLRDRFFTSN